MKNKEDYKIKKNLDKFNFKEDIKYCAKCKHSKPSVFNPIVRVDCTIYDEYHGLWWSQKAICTVNDEIEEKYEE